MTNLIEVKDIKPHLKLGILDLEAFSTINSLVNKRDLEKAGTVFLLKNLLNTVNFKLDYSPTNKPFLKGRNEHISISHSYNKLVIIINEFENTGVDVELMRDKILNIKLKFLNNSEQMLIDDNIETLTYIWAAKEVLYKIYGLKGLDYKNNLSIEINNKATFLGHIIIENSKKSYLLKKEKIQNYCLVYALNEV